MNIIFKAYEKNKYGNSHVCILLNLNTNVCWSCTVVHPGKERLIKKGWMVYLQNHFASNNNTDTLIVHIILSIIE